MLPKFKLVHFIFFAVILALSAFPSAGFAASSPVKPLASTAKAANVPDPTKNPVLAKILEMGSKIYYMGNQAGLDGWFILKDTQMQIAYTTPDNKYAVIGALFGANGDNITVQQIQNLVTNNPEVATSLSSFANGQANIGNVEQGKPSIPSPVPSALPTVTVSPGEKLTQDLLAAHGVEIGSSSAPEILMVMNPDCLHCQATWRAIRNAVFKNKVRLRFIPIGTPNTDEERAAAVLLHVKDPLNAWDKYVAGDTSQLAGTPDPAFVAEAHANHVLTDSWNIFATPYLVYRSKDGRVKVLQGEPDNISSVLDDLL